MTAYEQAMRDFEDRLEALGAKLGARDRVDEIHADSLKHVIDKFDARIEALAEAIEGHGGVYNRLDALETRVQNTRDVSADVFEASKIGLEALVERLETLESRAHGVMDRLRELDGYVERLEALEGVAELGMSLDELRRQDRWHATYNAALQSYSLYELGEAEMDRRCTAFADLRHGPLTP